jgi:hypothetical protein
MWFQRFVFKALAARFLSHDPIADLQLFAEGTARNGALAVRAAAGASGDASGALLGWLITSSLGGIDVLRRRAVFVANCKLDNDPSYVSAELNSLCEPLNGFCTRQW